MKNNDYEYTTEIKCMITKKSQLSMNELLLA